MTTPYVATPQHRVVYRKLDVPKADWGLPSGAVIAFAHMLTVPAGDFTHEPLRLREFQIEWIRAVYNPIDSRGLRLVRQAVLSVARRNGKTLLAAVLVLLHLVGPFKRPNATIVSAATTRKQAGVVFRYVADMVQMNPIIAGMLKVNDSTKHIAHIADGSFYEAISAEAGAQFGMGLDLAIYDELAHAKNRALYDALMTSLGSQKEGLMAIISTQAPSDDHLLSELLDYGEKINNGIIVDPSFASRLYTVPMSAELTDETQWKKANPALGDYRDIVEMRSTMARAVELPAQESATRVFYLNQRVRADQPFLSVKVWEDNAGAVNEAIFYDGRPVYGGLDLSATTDLTALVLACEDDEERVHLRSFAWTPESTLIERARRDRATYDVWQRQGFLLTPPGPAISLDYVAGDVLRITQGMRLTRIAYDPWRIQYLKESLDRLGTSLPLHPFKQNFMEMGPAVSLFETLALHRKLRHGGHPVLRWCMSNAVIVKDSAGNRKIDKRKYYGRVDLAVAAVMATATMKLGPPPVYVEAMIG